MKNRNANCDVCVVLDDQTFKIHETRYWKVFISDNQDYLGRSFVALTRHCPNLSEVTNDEWSDFRQLISTLEAAFKKAFGALHFNWTCLMNDAYKHVPAYPHVHWHLRPRYSHDVEFCGVVFKDPEFGHHYARSKDRPIDLSANQLIEIIEEVRKYI